jgi:hypothetical protein
MISSSREIIRLSLINAVQQFRSEYLLYQNEIKKLNTVAPDPNHHHFAVQDGGDARL